MSVANMPTLIPEVAFATTPADPSPTWVNVLADFRSASTTRGRQRELDRYQAGRLDMALNNRGRTYDPEYSAGPYYPNVKPMRRTRLRATWNAVTYPIIDTYTDKWDQNYIQPREATATLRATDGFKILNKKQLASSAFVTEITVDSPVHWWRLGEPSGSTILFDRAGGKDLTVNGTPTLGSAGLVTNDPDTAMTTATYTDGAMTAIATATVAGYPMTLAAIIKTTSVSGGGIILVVDSSGNQIVELGYDGNTAYIVGDTTAAQASVAGTVSIRDGNPHLVVGVWDGAGQLRLYIDGVSSGTPVTLTGTVNPSNQIGIAGGVAVSGGVESGIIGTIDEAMVFSAAVSATRITAWASARSAPWTGDTPGARLGRVLDAVAWPAALRNLDTGSSTLGSATLGQTALDHAQKVADSEFGELFMTRDGNVRLVGRTGLLNRASAGTFGDGPGELAYTNIGYDNGDQLIRNPVTVSRTGGVAQTSTDTTGTTEYLAHQYTLDGLYHDSDTLSRDAANFLVSEYKDPKTRVVSLTVDPLRDPTNLWPVVLGAELGDVLTVIRRPQGVGSAISQTCEIQGISHNITPNSWTVTFTLSPAYTGAFLQLDLTSGPGLDSLRLYF